MFTGQAFIFLRIPADGPSVVYYSLAVPHGGVGDSTGWTPALDGDNRLPLDCVSQLLAFTLKAIQTPPRNGQWRAVASESSRPR